MFSKSAIAGLAAGYAYKGIAHFAKKATGKKKNGLFFAAVFTSAVVVPTVNTAVYAAGMLFMFELLGSESFAIGMLVNNPDATNGGTYGSAVAVVFLYWININYFLELGMSVIASPALVTLIKALTRNYNLGFYNDFSKFNLDETEEELELSESVNI